MSLGVAIGVALGTAGYASLIEGSAAQGFAPDRSSAVTACRPQGEQPAEPEPDRTSEPAPEATRAAEPPVPELPPAPAPEPAPEGGPPAAAPSEQPATSEPEPDPDRGPPPTETAPELPLPRFPGSFVMDTRARWDEDKASWLLVHALRVPASLDQVEGFYAKALEEAGMAVQMLGRTLEQGVTRSILRGRSSTAHVQISLERPADQLQTRIRLIWRQWN